MYYQTPKALRTKGIAELAKTTSSVPATAAIKAFLAKTTFPGSPRAVRNNSPVITHKITTTPEAIQSVVTTAACTIDGIVTAAKATVGKNKTANKKYIILRLLMYFLDLLRKYRLNNTNNRESNDAYNNPSRSPDNRRSGYFNFGWITLSG